MSLNVPNKNPGDKFFSSELNEIVQGVNNLQESGLLLSGLDDPLDSLGENGNYYLNTTNKTIFGPKTNDLWGTGLVLKGDTGTNGADGIDGDSAYQIWLDEGNTGTEDDFLNSLNTPPNNNGGGWGYYVDDQYTSASPLVIPEGTTVQVTINNSSIINDQLPIGYNDFWDSSINRIKSKNAGDTVKFSLRIKGYSSVNQGGLAYGLYIGAGQTIKILGESKPFLRDSNEDNDILIEETPFHGETFRTNGGAFFLTAIRGDITLWDFAIKVELSYRADNQAVYNLVTGTDSPNNADGRPDGTIYLQI